MLIDSLREQTFKSLSLFMFVQRMKFVHVMEAVYMYINISALLKVTMCQVTSVVISIYNIQHGPKHNKVQNVQLLSLGRECTA